MTGRSINFKRILRINICCPVVSVVGGGVGGVGLVGVVEVTFLFGVT